MNTGTRFLIVAAVLMAVTINAPGGAPLGTSIGVNLGDTTSGGTTFGTGSAGVVPQFNWMHYGGDTATGVILSDNTGTLTSATMDWAGTALRPVIQAAAGVNGNDEALNNSYVALGTPFVFTISNIPYATYDLITYTSSIFTGRPISTTVGSTTLWGLAPDPTGPGYIDNLPSAYIYTSAVGATAGTATPDGNYFHFSNLTGSTLVFTMNSTTDLPQITAFQIVQTPEPGSALLLLGGGCALGLRRMRAKR